MPNLERWIAQDTDSIDVSTRAVLTWRRILDDPTSVTFRKLDGSTLAAQKVRIESMQRVFAFESAAGRTLRRETWILGVRDHPTVTDTDIAEGYRFVHQDEEYQVTEIIYQTGEIQAHVEVVA